MRNKMALLVDIFLLKVFMMGGVIIPLPFMVLRHRALEKEYKLN